MEGWTSQYAVPAKRPTGLEPRLLYFVILDLEFLSLGFTRITRRGTHLSCHSPMAPRPSGSIGRLSQPMSSTPAICSTASRPRSSGRGAAPPCSWGSWLVSPKNSANDSAASSGRFARFSAPCCCLERGRPACYSRASLSLTPQPVTNVPACQRHEIEIEDRHRQLDRELEFEVELETDMRLRLGLRL